MSNPPASRLSRLTSAALYFSWPISTSTSTTRRDSSTADAVNAMKPPMLKDALPISSSASRLVPTVMAVMLVSTGNEKRCRPPIRHSTCSRRHHFACQHRELQCEVELH